MGLDEGGRELEMEGDKLVDEVGNVVSCFDDE